MSMPATPDLLQGISEALAEATLLPAQTGMSGLSNKIISMPATPDLQQGISEALAEVTSLPAQTDISGLSNKIISMPATPDLLQGISEALAEVTLLPAQTASIEQPNLSTMPAELIIELYSAFGDDSDGLCGKFCLAMTSVKMYRIYKALYPATIDWRVGPALLDEEGDRWEHTVQYHIAVFLGPTYRRHRFDKKMHYPLRRWCPFVSRAIYGNSYGMMESKLNDRYYEWGGNYLNRNPALNRFFLGMASPFNLGDEWDSIAFKAIGKVQRTGHYYVHTGAVTILSELMCLGTYNRMMVAYEDFYDGFGEWATMVGI